LQHVARERPFLEIGYRIGRLVAGFIEPSVRRDVGLIKIVLVPQKMKVGVVICPLFGNPPCLKR
jgi:hypothetical protein